MLPLLLNLGMAGSEAPEGSVGASPLGAAVAFAPYACGPEPLTIPAGEDGFVSLVDLFEPISAGAPPIAPAFIRRIDAGGDVVRITPRSGPTITRPRLSCDRARYTVGWNGMDREARDALLAWVRDDLGGMLRGFYIEPDGPGTGAVRVRMTADYTDLWRNRPVWDSAEVECEEVG